MTQRWQGRGRCAALLLTCRSYKSNIADSHMCSRAEEVLCHIHEQKTIYRYCSGGLKLVLPWRLGLQGKVQADSHHDFYALPLHLGNGVQPLFARLRSLSTTAAMRAPQEVYCIAVSQAVHKQCSLGFCRLASSPGFRLALPQVLATRFNPSVAFLSADSTWVCHASFPNADSNSIPLGLGHAASLPAAATCSLQHASAGWPPEQSRGCCMPTSCMR